MLKEPRTYEERQDHIERVEEIFDNFTATEWDLLPEYYQHLFASWRAVEEAGRSEEVMAGYYNLGRAIRSTNVELYDSKKYRQQVRMIERTGCPACDCLIDCDNVVGCDDCCETCSSCWNTKETQNKLRVRKARLLEVKVKVHLGSTGRGGIRSATTGHEMYCVCSDCVEPNRMRVKYWKTKAEKNGIKV